MVAYRAGSHSILELKGFRAAGSLILQVTEHLTQKGILLQLRAGLVFMSSEVATGLAGPTTVGVGGICSVYSTFVPQLWTLAVIPSSQEGTFVCCAQVLG